MPLWTTMNSLVGSDRRGWQLMTEGTPWVAHRVWAMEQCETNVLLVLMVESAMRLRRPTTLPTSLKSTISPGLSPSMPIPAESYPRYSKRDKPLQSVSQMHLRSMEKREKWAIIISDKSSARRVVINAPFRQGSCSTRRFHTSSYMSAKVKFSTRDRRRQEETYLGDGRGGERDRC